MEPHLGNDQLLELLESLLQEPAQIAGIPGLEEHTTLEALADLYSEKYQHTSRPEDIDNSISHLSRAIRIVPDDIEDKPRLIASLADAYLLRFDHLDKLDDINQATKRYSRAVALVSDDNPSKPGWLNDLGVACRRRFERLNEFSDINLAFQSQSRAMGLIPTGYAAEATLLRNLGDTYMSRAKGANQLSDANEAIVLYNQALLLAPHGHPAKPGIFGDIGHSYKFRFQCLNQQADIDAAIGYQTQAVSLTSTSNAEKASLLNSLGISLLDRFDHSGILDDLETAKNCQRQAVQMTPDEHTSRPGYLDCLGTVHLRCFMRFGKRSEVNESIRHHNSAIVLASGHRLDQSGWLNNLGNAYLCRFQYFLDIVDLDKAIESYSQAMLSATDGHAVRQLAGQLSNYGAAFMCRFGLSEDLDDIKKAIDCQNQAVLLTPNDHLDKPARLDQLGASYLNRFLRAGEPEDIEKAIECSAEALLLTPDGRSDMARRLQSVGNAHSCRFDRLKDIEDIERAIECGKKSVDLFANEHASKAQGLYYLGESYDRRFMHLSQRSDIESACGCFRLATELNTTQPILKYKSARKWARACLLLDVLPQAAFQNALEVVPQIAWLGTTFDYRFDVLKDIGSFTMEAVSWSISAGKYSLALEWLEQGRSIVWRQMLQLRAPLAKLSTTQPALAEQLEKVGRELQFAALTSSKSLFVKSVVSASEDETQLRHHLADEWTRLLEQVREIPGFREFMRPLRAAALIRAAEKNSIVIINVHSDHADALIIRPNTSDIAHIALKNFTQGKAVDLCARLFPFVGRQGTGRGASSRDGPSGLRYIGRRLVRPDNSFKSMLASLWDDVVKPVLDFLGYTHAEHSHDLPRVTWCATGALSFLPLHAAGCYDGSQPNAFDLVVSSYTPTLSTLLSSELRDLTLSPDIVAIGQEDTNGMSSLPYTRVELAAIKAHASGHQFLQLEGEEATIEAVLRAMEEHNSVHLACHATQQVDKPLDSAFHLHDGDLTLSTIAKKYFNNKGLAFLSACQTAAGDNEMPDESVHLAAGMILAGYRTVIATMWSIEDQDAPEVARWVYSELLKNRTLDPSEVARALHQAIARLRDMVGETSFERWIPFIHVGL